MTRCCKRAAKLLKKNMLHKKYTVQLAQINKALTNSTNKSN